MSHIPGTDMLTKQDLDDLAAGSDAIGYCVSVYLDVSPSDNPRGEYLLHFKNLAKAGLASAEPWVRGEVSRDLELVERFLSDRPERMKRGLAVFSAHRRGLWKVYHMPIPFHNQLLIDRKPFIKPLATTLDLYQRYLIIVLAGNEARLFLAERGEVQEVTRVSRPAPPRDRTRDGSWGDMGQLRAVNQREQVQRLLFKDLVLLAERIVREEEIKRILLGGTDKVRGRFRDALPLAMKEKLVGEFSVGKTVNPSGLLEKCAPIMREVERRFEKRALSELFDHVGEPVGSVLGLSDVLTALQQGNVRKLYVLADMVVPGMVCNRCGALTPERTLPCPYCGGEMTRLNHMLDLAIQRAVEQGARVDLLEESDQLREAGGIGARLRY